MKIGKDFVELTSIHREPAGVNRDMILSKLVINEDGTVTGEVVDAERIERKPGADGLFPWRITTRITDPKCLR